MLGPVVWLLAVGVLLIGTGLHHVALVGRRLIKSIEGPER